MPAEVESADGGQNYYVRLDLRPFAPARVFCGTRPSDGERLWFYGDGSEWITEADEPHSITAALTWLKGKHAEAEAERTRLRAVLDLDEADPPGDDDGDDVPFAAEAEPEGAPLVRT
ncbi:hypothetical protein J4573_41585 [Actinomadura barringtoniae]|uniref:Uncharacterized protein n=1 Tax=Actinomadura barringtoniae TaxID=1427535 RepID=A0A939TER9_9ACTN|nr:hypothetical protein [Actinomadura barringtoniae]MBO2453640.1 hypothetical protein [Actinomadura barringtoniae]